ncbi:hypothetical protein MBLNU459_g6497t3 [Dothideomycetes sp. NU459]
MTTTILHGVHYAVRENRNSITKQWCNHKPTLILAPANGMSPWKLDARNKFPDDLIVKLFFDSPGRAPEEDRAQTLGKTASDLEAYVKSLDPNDPNTERVTPPGRQNDPRTIPGFLVSEIVVDEYHTHSSSTTGFLSKYVKADKWQYSKFGVGIALIPCSADAISPDGEDEGRPSLGDVANNTPLRGGPNNTPTKPVETPVERQLSPDSDISGKESKATFEARKRAVVQKIEEDWHLSRGGKPKTETVQADLRGLKLDGEWLETERAKVPRVIPAPRLVLATPTPSARRKKATLPIVIELEEDWQMEEDWRLARGGEAKVEKIQRGVRALKRDGEWLEIEKVRVPRVMPTTPKQELGHSPFSGTKGGEREEEERHDSICARPEAFLQLSLSDLMGGVREARQRKIVLFCNWPHNQFDYEVSCCTAGLPFVTVKAEQTWAQRDRAVADFQDPLHPSRILITSLRIISTSLNLQSATRVIMVDVPPSAATYYQAMSRVWRIGQTHTAEVEVLLLDNDNSVDQLVAANMEKKQVSVIAGLTIWHRTS